MAIVRCSGSRGATQFRGLGQTAAFALALLVVFNASFLPVSAFGSDQETLEKPCGSASKVLGDEEGRALCAKLADAFRNSDGRDDGTLKREVEESQVSGDGTCYPGRSPVPEDPFQCVSGSFYCGSALALSDLTIKNSLITFASDLYVNNSLRFEEHDARIKVAGCLTVVPSATISLVFSDIGVEVLSKISDDGYKTLVLAEQAGTGCPSLETLQIKGSVTGSTCKRLHFKTIASQNQLSVKVTVSFARCEPGLIIVSVILFVIAVFSLLLTFLLVFTPVGKLSACR